MANYAELTANIERGYGIPWRVGDVVAGTLAVRDRGRSLIEPANNNSSVSGFTYRLSAGEWDAIGLPVEIASAPTDGELHFSFEPDKEGTYRVRFVLEGDYKAVTELTVRVHDPVDRKSAGGDTSWDDPI